MEREAVTHVPALLEEYFDIPRSKGRMMIAKGLVQVNGTTIGMPDMDMESAKLSGATIKAGKDTAHLLGRRPPEMVNSGPMDPQMVMGGI